MSEVYIDSLTLENFGPFYGEHTLNFGSLEGRCGILVGGKTEQGKPIFYGHFIWPLSVRAALEFGNVSQRSL